MRDCPTSLPDVIRRMPILGPLSRDAHNFGKPPLDLLSQWGTRSQCLAKDPNMEMRAFTQAGCGLFVLLREWFGSRLQGLGVGGQGLARRIERAGVGCRGLA